MVIFHSYVSLPEGNLVGLYDIDLVGGIPTHLKNMSSSVGIIVPNIWTNKKCLKPPTSDDWGFFHGDCHRKNMGR